MFIDMRHGRDKENGINHVLVNLQTGDIIKYVVVANDEVGFYVTTEGHVYHGQPIKLVTREEYMQRSTNSSNSRIPDSAAADMLQEVLETPILIIPSRINSDAVVRGRRV